MQSEDLTTAPSHQLTASPTITALLSILGAPLLTILFTWLSTRLNLGDDVKAQIQLYLLGTGGIGAVTGVVGVVQRGLKLTDAKIANLTPQKLPDSINAGGDVQVGATVAPQLDSSSGEEHLISADELQRAAVIAQESEVQDANQES